MVAAFFLGLAFAPTASTTEDFVQGRVFTSEYTLSNTGCPCWYDIQANDTRCACCKNGGVQCGYPINNFCWREETLGAVSRINSGCPGIAMRQYTLSTTGSPCPWDVRDRTCSWCSTDGWLCPMPHTITGEGGDKQYQKTKQGALRNVCVHERMARKLYRAGKHVKYCKKGADCSLWPAMCSVDATCENVEYLPGYNTHVCVCKTGFVGNGVQCVHQNSSAIRDPLQGAAIEFDLKVTTELFLGPKGDNATQLSDSTFQELEEFLNTGKTNDTIGGSQCQLVGSSTQSRSFGPHNYRSVMLDASESFMPL